MRTKKVDIIVDLQYGSTGKGLIAGYLAVKNRYDVVVNANMPNAGHTFIDAKGQKMIHKVLPNGIVSPHCRVALIGPGSIFSVDQLIDEVELAKQFGYMQGIMVLIHENAVHLASYHKEREKLMANGIGSTKQGSAAAMISKITRNIEDKVIVRDMVQGYKDALALCCIYIVSGNEYNKIIAGADKILAEGAQGFSLGINEKFYPYCTSRDCSPARFMSDMAIPLPYLKTVIGTARTYPIRVGGTSGPCYDDQKETSWDELGLAEEHTTVTGRVRRVFTFSDMQIDDAIHMFAPDEIFLNFCNYIEDSDTMADMIHSITKMGGDVRYLGHGPTINDIEEI